MDRHQTDALLLIARCGKQQQVSADADGPAQRATSRRHAQSLIALYTKLDAECDKQVTVVGRLLTTLEHMSIVATCRQQQTDDDRLFVALDDGERAVVNSEGSPSVCAKNELQTYSTAVLTQHRRVTDTATHTHTPVDNTRP